MKTLILSLFALLPLCTSAAPPPEVEALIAAARAAAGEFAADPLIRLAAVESIDKERRVELLTQAFEFAAAAQQPYRRVPALVRLPGPVGAVNKAYSQELDALSLRLRAVEGMLPLDAAKARQLLAKIPDLKLPRATCGDFLVPDVSRYYELLEKIAGPADAAEKRALLDRAAASVSSPVQIGPMARVLTFADTPDETFASVLATFSKSLGRVSGDDRSFTYARQVGMQIEALTTECKRRRVSPLPMLEGYRVYLVFNLSAARCADDSVQGGGLTVIATAETEPKAGDLTAHFNQKLRTAPLQPIQELESTPSRVEGTATGPRDCQDPQCAQTAALYRELMLSPEGNPIPQLQRNTPQWAEKLQRVLQSLAAWKPTPTLTAIELFRERSAAYSNLLNLAPAGTGRGMVTRAMLQFVAQHPVQKTHRMEWLLAVNSLIARTTIDPLGYRAFVDDLKKSTDPVIALYAALEGIAPRPADRILSLL
jgi:hypothetical protein